MTTRRKLAIALAGAALFTGAGFSWHARAETESSEQLPTPHVFQGKQFTVIFSNGDKQEFAQYVRTIIINGQPWMLLQHPNGTGGSGQLLINPAQVRAIEGVP
jgi:hypothetical protein